MHFRKNIAQLSKDAYLQSSGLNCKLRSAFSRGPKICTALKTCSEEHRTPVSLVSASVIHLVKLCIALKEQLYPEHCVCTCISFAKVSNVPYIACVNIKHSLEKQKLRTYPQNAYESAAVVRLAEYTIPHSLPNFSIYSRSSHESVLMCSNQEKTRICIN